MRESNLNPGKKQIRFINVVVNLQDRLGTGEISVVQLNNEYDLQITLILIWFNSSVGFTLS